MVLQPAFFNFTQLVDETLFVLVVSHEIVLLYSECAQLFHCIQLQRWLIPFSSGLRLRLRDRRNNLTIKYNCHICPKTSPKTKTKNFSSGYFRNCSNCDSTAMVISSFHVYSRSSHHFILYNEHSGYRCHQKHRISTECDEAMLLHQEHKVVHQVVAFC